jgi:excinuclease ABC subunit C
MKDKEGTVLYVGKAKNLRARISSYFREGGDARPQVPYLLSHIADIETLCVPSEKEALLLENTLIKKHKPKYNILLKDDKGYLSLKFTSKHPYPMLQLVRLKGAFPKDGEYFGPYTNAGAARYMFDLALQCFRLRQCSDEEFARRTRPCILYQIKMCSAPCVGLVSQEEYQDQIQGAKKLLRGQSEEVLKALDFQIRKASDALEFEKAAELLARRKKIAAASEKQSIETPARMDIDSWAIVRNRQMAVVTKVFWREGKLVGSCHFSLENPVQPSDELLESSLMQHYVSGHEMLPSKIFLSMEIANPGALAAVLFDQTGKNVEIIVPKKGEKKRLTDIALMNAESFLTKAEAQKSDREKILLELQNSLGLSRYPGRIDCFDTSHFAGTELVASCVAFAGGVKHPSLWRRYIIRSVAKGDDLAMMQEVLERRYQKAQELPDLIIIDGGKAQLEAARKVLHRLEIVSCDLIALAKESGRHDKGQTQEQVYTLSSKTPFLFDRHSPVLFFLQKVRDEAHRFALEFQKTRRTKAVVKSALDDIPGIGPIKKKKLLKAFGSVKEIKTKTLDELVKGSGISRKDAERVLAFFLS